MSDNKVRVSKTKQRYKQDPKEPKFRMVSKEKAKWITKEEWDKANTSGKSKPKWITEDQWDKANKREPRKQNPNKLKLKSPSGGMGSGMRRFYKGGKV